MVQQELLKDWKTVVGSGPFMVTDYSSGTATIYDKNPNYWNYDERFPKNKLPYIDTLKEIVIPDTPTAVAALRTGKIDMLEQSNTILWKEAQNIAKTNPEIIQGVWPTPGQDLQMRVDKTPFSDKKWPRHFFRDT